MKVKQKHQAASAKAIPTGNRVGWQGICRCGWFSTFIRATAESASQDTQDHIRDSR